MKSLTILKLETVTRAYPASAKAIPKPVAKPARKPCCRVRFMQSRDMGPTGAATAKPKPMPLRRGAQKIMELVPKGAAGHSGFL
ncbi:hypothetical protein D3C75_1211210 [compost metagenome]